MTTNSDKPGPKEAQEVVISLYAAGKKIYPRSVKGLFNTWRWALVWITQIIFYGASTCSAWCSIRRTSST
jgi:hypothetical protein